MAADLDGRPDAVSTATAFKYHRPFPVCLEADTFWPSTYTWCRDLSLSQAMGFFWNTENFVLTTAASASGTYAGTAYAISANGTFSLSPLGVTGDWSTGTKYNGSSTWMGLGGYPASGDYIKTPSQRVCGVYPATYQWESAVCAEVGAPFDALGSYWEIALIVAEDSANAGRYAVGIRFQLRFRQNTSYHIFYANGSYSGGNVVIATGTLTIGCASWPFYCITTLPAASTGFSVSGGSLSAVTTDFTY